MFQQNMIGNMPNNNWMFFGMPLNMNNWTNVYENSLNFQNIQNQQQNFYNNNNNNMINIIFKSTAGLKMNVLVDPGTSLCDAILLFLKRCGKTELFKPDSGIYFLFNTRSLNIYDKTKVFNVCGGQTNPVVLVIDAHNLIGAY